MTNEEKNYPHIVDLAFYKKAEKTKKYSQEVKKTNSLIL